MTQATITDLVLHLLKIDNWQTPIYFLTSESDVIPLTQEQLNGGIICEVGPVKAMNIPRHLIIKCPPCISKGTNGPET